MVEWMVMERGEGKEMGRLEMLWMARWLLLGQRGLADGMRLEMDGDGQMADYRSAWMGR